MAFSLKTPPSAQKCHVFENSLFFKFCSLYILIFLNSKNIKESKIVANQQQPSFYNNQKQPIRKEELLKSIYILQVNPTD